MEVLITGSRDWKNFKAMLDALSALPKDTLLIHGDCRGADQMAGLIAERHYSLKAVLRYAKTFLVTRETKQKIEDEELEKLEEEIKRQRIKRMADEGRYIPRESFELELAGRGSALETGLKGEIQTRTVELIDLIQGDQRKARDFVSEMFAIIDKGLNQFANNKEWQVIFQDEVSDD